MDFSIWFIVTFLMSDKMDYMTDTRHPLNGYGDSIVQIRYGLVSSSNLSNNTPAPSHLARKMLQSDWLEVLPAIQVPVVRIP